MSWDVIRKQAEGKGLFPNLRDYDAVREAFTWGSVRAELAMPGGLNIAYHVLDRHVAEGRGEKLALRWLGKNGKKRDITYRELLELSCRFANLLSGLGVGQGDRVLSLRSAEYPSSTLRHWGHCATAACSRHCSRPSAQNRCAPGWRSVRQRSL